MEFAISMSNATRSRWNGRGRLQREFGGAVRHTDHEIEYLPAGDADNIVLNFDCILDIAGVIP